MFDKSIFKLPKINTLFLKLAVLSTLQAFAIILGSLSLSESIVIFWTNFKKENIPSSIILFLALTVVGFSLNFGIEYFKNLTAQKFSNDSVAILRTKLVNKVTEFGESTPLELGRGHLLELLNSGLNQIKTYFELIFVKVIDLSITPWAFLVSMFFFDWRLALFLLLIFPVIIIFFVILGLAAQSKADEEYANFTKLNNQFNDVLHGLQTLKQLGLGRVFAEKIYQTSEDYRKTTMRTLRIAITSTFALDFFTTLSIAVIAVFLGFNLIDGKISLFPALSFLILAPQYFLPLRNFADDYHATLDGKNAYKEISEVVSAPSNVVDQLSIPNLDKQIELSVVNFNYQYLNSESGLSEISFDIPKKMKVGIVGLSGSGKTTLINNIAGLLPGFGQVKINGANTDTFLNNDWRKEIVYIPQNPFLFSGTIRDNLKLIDDSLTEQEMEQALAEAGIEDLGLDFIIQEFAQNLSGGQAQRVSIAKAFLASQNKQIILLDEPTAHLDLETELSIKKSMLRLFKNKLVFFATHRLHWVNNFDYLLVIKDGRIVEQGKPADLKKQTKSFLNQMLKESEL